MSKYLQYRVSSWNQLSQCKSNNSDELEIKVSKYTQNYDIEGTKISVVHPKYGTLFAYTIWPKGDLITDITGDIDNVVTHDILLNELKRYGFYVMFVEENRLPAGQVRLLRTLQGLHFDKIRMISVQDLSSDFQASIRITAFNVQKHEDWLNSGYSPTKLEWESAILDGTAFNISGLDEAKKYSWNWLYNIIADIDKILLRNDEDG